MISVCRSWTNITSHVRGGTGKKKKNQKRKKTRVKRRIRSGSLFTSCALHGHCSSKTAAIHRGLCIRVWIDRSVSLRRRERVLRLYPMYKRHGRRKDLRKVHGFGWHFFFFLLHYLFGVHWNFYGWRNIEVARKSPAPNTPSIYGWFGRKRDGDNGFSGGNGANVWVSLSSKISSSTSQQKAASFFNFRGANPAIKSGGITQRVPRRVPKKRIVGRRTVDGAMRVPSNSS